MKRHTLLAVLLLSFSFVHPQDTIKTHFKLSKATVVKDSSGAEYPYEIWQGLLRSGNYNLKPVDPQNAETAFVLLKLSPEEKEKRMRAMPKPRESNAFKTGSNFSSFKTTDINGKKINSKDLKGKILVLNFWFINCPPCKMEIPDLNELAASYKNDSIIFIAIALDQKYELKDFLKTTPFLYSIVDNGRYLSAQYNLNMYPTNVVVDQQGKIYFHSTGYSANTVFWIKKSIEELKSKSEENKLIN